MPLALALFLQPLFDCLVSEPVDGGERHVAPQRQAESAPERPDALRRDHPAHAGDCVAEGVRAGGLQSGAKQLERGDCGGGDGARGGAGEEGRPGCAERGERGGPQCVVAGEVDDVGGDGHEQGRGETAPEGGDALIARDLDEPLPGPVEAAARGLLDDAGVGEGRGRGGGGRGGECDAGFGGVCDPEDLAAARGDAELGGREGGRGLEVQRGEREFVGAERGVLQRRDGGGGGAGWDGGVLRLQTDADDVEGGHCGPRVLASRISSAYIQKTNPSKKKEKKKEKRKHSPSKLVNRLPEHAASIFCVAVIWVSTCPPPPLPAPDCCCCCCRRSPCSSRAVMNSLVPLMVSKPCAVPSSSSKGESSFTVLIMMVSVVSDGDRERVTAAGGGGGTLRVCDTTTTAATTTTTIRPWPPPRDAECNAMQGRAGRGTHSLTLQARGCVCLRVGNVGLSAVGQDVRDILVG